MQESTEIAGASAPTARVAPPPLHGGPLTVLRFMRRHRMFKPRYVRMLARLLWLKLRWRSRLQTDGICFVESDVTFEIGRHAVVRLGRWSWVGRGCKIRAHEGEFELGAKSVLGQECTISAFKHVSIGRECVIADRVMLIDFDHGIADSETPIRHQGLVKGDVRVGHNCWIGYGVSVLRDVTVGDNSVLAAGAVVATDVPADAVAGGVPARVLKMRDEPRTLRWQ